MTHPYHSLIDQEARRAEEDLVAFRSRALTMVTTSSGIVTLLAAVIALTATDDPAISDAATWTFVIALGFFIAAAVVALTANMAAGIERPSGKDLERITTPDGWSEFATSEQEREVAEVVVKYVVTVRGVATTTARRLNTAIALQIVGLGLAAFASLMAILSSSE